MPSVSAARFFRVEACGGGHRRCGPLPPPGCGPRALAEPILGVVYLLLYPNLRPARLLQSPIFSGAVELSKEGREPAARGRRRGSIHWGLRPLRGGKRGKDLAEWKIGVTFVCGKLAEWSIAAVLKTVEPQGSGGSNPSLSAGVLRRRGESPVVFFVPSRSIPASARSAPRPRSATPGPQPALSAPQFPPRRRRQWGSAGGFRKICYICPKF